MIIYFSGTGNTRHCARILAGLLDENLYELSVADLRDPASATIVLPEGESRIVWAFPTYSWGLPPVVVTFMEKAVLPHAAQVAAHYMLTSCGDDMAYADRQWRRILKRRGIVGREAFAIEMPNTYTLMKGFDVDSAEVEARKLEACDSRIAEIADAIKSGKPSSLIRGAFPFIKSAVIYPWFRRFAMSPQPFRATEGCVGCGLCSRSCPMGNIRLENTRPHWDKLCALCLRCYHICPQHAVAYGKVTEGKGQYMCPK